MRSWGPFVASILISAVMPCLLSQGTPLSPLNPMHVDAVGMQARPNTNTSPDCPKNVNCAALSSPVMVSLVIEREGYVERATYLSGPEQLRAAALFSARQWTYKPYLVNGSAVRIETIVSVNFGSSDAPLAKVLTAVVASGPEVQKKTLTPDKSAATSSGARDPVESHTDLQWRTPAAMKTTGHAGSALLPSSTMPSLTTVRGTISTRLYEDEVRHDASAWRLLRQVPPVYPVDAEASGIQGIVQVQAVIQRDGVLEQVQAVSGPQELRQAAIDAASQYQYVPVNQNGRRTEAATSFAIEFLLRGPAHVAPEVMAGLIEQSPRPEYPLSAVAAGVHGAMRLHVLIGREGEVLNAQVLSGPPLLRDSALEAIKRWRYKPYLRNGAHVEVDTTVLVTFVLPQE